MSRIVSIGLLGVYLLFSVGVVVLIHTCGGSSTFDLMPVSAADPCGCSDPTSGDGCCTLSLRSFQINDDQSAAPRIAPVCAVDVCAILPVEVSSASEAAAVRPVSVNSSPPHEVSPTLLGCVLLI